MNSVETTPTLSSNRAVTVTLLLVGFVMFALTKVSVGGIRSSPLPPEILEALRLISAYTGYTPTLAASVAIASYLEALRIDEKRGNV